MSLPGCARLRQDRGSIHHTSRPFSGCADRTYRFRNSALVTWKCDDITALETSRDHDLIEGIVPQHELSRTLREWIGTEVRENDRRIDETDTIDERLYETAADLGLLASDYLWRDNEPHGSTARLTYFFSVLAEMGSVSPSFAKALMDQNFGQIGMLREYGDSLFRNGLLRQIRTGTTQVAFAMTEPQGGSNVTRMTTTATPTEGGYRIRGDKDWITGAERRQVHFVVAKDVEDHRAIGLSAVDRTANADGRVMVGDRKEKHGLRGLGEHRVSYQDAFCPVQSVVLSPDLENLPKIMKHYNVKRAGQAAICLGAAKGAMRSAYAYCTERFAPSEAGYKNMERTLAPLVAELKAAETMLDWTARQLAEGDDRSGMPSGMVKVVTSELSVRVASAAAQVCGANGLSSALPIERLFRDVRMLTIAGGASEVILAKIGNRLNELL